MRCPICKTVFLGPITLVDGLPARQCSNCKGVSISSNVYLTWRRTLGREFPPKEGTVQRDLDGSHAAQIAELLADALTDSGRER